jgi:type IV secretion system protein VirD4
MTNGTVGGWRSEITMGETDEREGVTFITNRLKWFAAWAFSGLCGLIILGYVLGLGALFLAEIGAQGSLSAAVPVWKAEATHRRLVLGRLITDSDLRTKAFGLATVIICGGVFAFMSLRQSSGAAGPAPASSYGSHGTGRWAAPDEIAEAFAAGGPGAVLGRQSQGRWGWRPIIFPWSTTRGNRFILLIGPPGSGKTFCYSLPNLLHTAACDKQRSLILTDPKGDLLRDTAALMERAGFQVLTLNLINFEASCRYNPMDYVATPEQAQKLAATIIANTDGAHAGGDPFWREAEGSLLACMIWYVKNAVAPEHQHLGTVLHLTNAFGADKTLMDAAFAQFGQDHTVRRLYGPVALLEDKTRTGVFVGATACRLKIWASDQITALTAASDVKIRDLAERPTVLYLIIPDHDPTFRVLSSLFFDQAFQELIAHADESGGRLKTECRLLLEEMANIGRIPDLEKRLATIRSRGILVEMVLQTLGQLKALYGDAWNTICGCADTMLVLAANDLETARYVSERLGTTTIKTQSQSQSQTDKGGSEGISFAYTARPLMLPDEVAGQGDGGLKPDELLLIQRGLPPARLLKYPAAEFPGHERIERVMPAQYKPPDRKKVTLIDPQTLRTVRSKAAEEGADDNDAGHKPTWKSS